MNQKVQTEGPDRSETVAFRGSAQMKHLVRAAASKYQVLPSDWLRAAVEQALEEELGPGCLGRDPLTAEDFAQLRYEAKELAEDEPGPPDG